ncbi:MAG: response regulator [Legionella sp.]|nr:MAG: response regulator [Legionella sp.]
MRVLIVEDNAFNAFCLRRLLESTIAMLSVTIVSNSQAALTLMQQQLPDLVIIDGDLGQVSEIQYNGPILADILIQKYPQLPIIAWSNSASMVQAFAHVFKHHQRSLNQYNCWSKMVNAESILQTWTHYFGESMSDNKALNYGASARAC